MASGQPLYEEPREAGAEHRAEQLREVEALVRRERKRAERERSDYFQPDLTSTARYARSIRKYRRDYLGMLGWPLAPRPQHVPEAKAQVRFVAEDALGRIYRVWVRTLPRVRTYGLLFLPPGKGPHPLVISQHGGGGTPELCSGFFGSANYNDMTRRVLRRGFAVFAPQLLLWQEQFGPAHNRQQVDVHLKQLDGSITALEVFRIQRCLDWLTSRKDIDASRIGMIGLSYGGFYALYTPAAEPRIRATVSSCFFNDRTVYNHVDWVWKGAARRFLDTEVAALICPRPLYIEVGANDTLFDVKHAGREARQVAALYRKLGLRGRFRYVEFGGGHELDTADANIDFLCRHVRDA